MDDLSHKKLIITPILVFYGSVILTCVANMTLTGKISSGETRIYSYLVPKYIDDANQIWCISCSLMIMGYQLALTKSFPSIDFNLKDKKTIKNIYYVLLIMNILTVLGLGINYRSGVVLRIFGLLNTIGVLFFARLWGKEDDKKYRLYAISLYILETYIALTTSYLRLELILPTVYLFTGYFIGKHELRYMFTYRVIPFVLAVILFSSVFGSLQKNRANFITVFDQQDANSDEATQSGSKGLLLDRCANIAQLTNVVNLVQRNGFYDGRASAPLIVALIPRFLWPDKPKIEIGTWFALEIGGAYKSETGKINNSINMTIPGELYLDFGWPGLVLGSLLMGAFMSALWNSTKFYGSDYNLSGIIFGGYLIFVSLLSFGADMQIILTLISTYLIFVVIKKLAKTI